MSEFEELEDKLDKLKQLEDLYTVLFGPVPASPQEFLSRQKAKQEAQGRMVARLVGLGVLSPEDLEAAPERQSDAV